jgi:hypothetical protein
MLHRLRTYLFLGATALAIGLAPLPTVATSVVDGMKGTLVNSSLPQAPGDEGIERVVGLSIQVFLSLFGIIFLVLLIYGGYKWLMAAGREDEVEKGKETIRAAIIGLAIVMSAYVVSIYVIDAFSQATNFKG